METPTNPPALVRSNAPRRPNAKTRVRVITMPVDLGPSGDAHFVTGYGYVTNYEYHVEFVQVLRRTRRGIVLKIAKQRHLPLTLAGAKASMEADDVMRHHAKVQTTTGRIEFVHFKHQEQPLLADQLVPLTL